MTGPGRDIPLLDARDIVKHYPIRGGVFMRQTGAVRAVDGVSLRIGAGETVGLVGESGCGKTTFGRTILRLEEPTAGEIRFEGRDIRTHSKAQMQALRREMQIIFQDPFSSLNPRKTVGHIVGEPLLVHGVRNRAEREGRVLELLERVGLRRFASVHAGELAYGRKRTLEIATTLAMEPELMLLDEPTAGMGHEDVHRVKDLIKEVAAGRTVLMVEHNMSVVSGICDKISVLQRGAVLAEGTYAEVSANPQVVEAYMGTLDD